MASRWVGNRLAGLTRDQMQGNADLGNSMTERFNVGGAMLLKLFGRRDEEDREFAAKAGLVRDLGVRIAVITRVFGAALMLIPALATALVYGVGGILVIDQSLTSARCSRSRRCCSGSSARCRASPTCGST